MEIKKIYILLFTFCIMFFVFNTNCYATGEDSGLGFDFPVNQYVTEEYFEIFVLYHGSSYDINVIASNDSRLKSISSADYFKYSYMDTGGGYYHHRITYYPVDFDYTVYRFRKGGTYESAWVKYSTDNVSSNSTSTRYIQFDGSDVVSSTVDIYNVDGTIFFQAPLTVNPLVEETLALIAEETPKMATETVAQMKIILLCGVGCLALLISLPLLLKVFSRFQ